MLPAVAGFMVLVHLYVWWRLVWSATAHRPTRVVSLLALVPLTLLGVLSVRALLAVSFPAWLAWTGFLWVGTVCYLAFWLVVLEIPRAVGTLLPLRRGTAGDGTARRTGTGPRTRPRVLSIVALLATGATVGYGLHSALGTPNVHEAEIPVRGLAPGLSGLRVAVLSDTHLWPFLGEEEVRRAVEIINDNDPDLVVLAGDLVDAPVERIGDDVAPLADLRAEHGVVFVTGNHEYYHSSGDLESWTKRLGELGVRVLRNERVTVEQEGARLDVAGVNDAAGHAHGDGPDYEAALGGRDEDVPVVLVAHTPAQVFEAVEYGVDLQISGHTHGGQTVPLSYLRARETPVLSGLGRVADTRLYVTNGAGFYGPPLRVGVPPQIGLLTLRPDPAP